jgi:hypothetical protein
VASEAVLQLSVQQQEFVYVATFDRPMFEFAARWIELQATLLDRLAPFGLNLAGIKNESTSSAAADFVLAAWLLDTNSIVRYRLDRIEVWSNRPQPTRDPGAVGAFCAAAVGVQRDLASSKRITRQSVTLALHGALADGDSRGLVSRYVGQVPRGIAGIRASGASFVCDLEAGEGRANWVLEQSAVVADGLFMRAVVERQDPAVPEQVVGEALELIQRQARGFGLSLAWS